MKPGPPPTPTAIRLARGNPGRRPLPEAEPTPDPLADLTPPLDLSDEAKKKWSELAPRLSALGVLSELDGTALAMLCESIARWSEAERQLRKYGLLIKSGSNNGIPVVSPYLAISRHAAREVSRLLAEFGLTPAHRSRVVALPSAALDAERDRFFGPPRLVPPPRKRRCVTGR